MTTVNNIMDLFTEVGSIQIFVDGDLYQFTNEELPKEVLDMKISSIDNPEFNEEVHPLCLNIDISEFDDYDSFIEEFKEYIIC